MKKKIAVFAGGWGGEYLVEALDGIISGANNQNTDVFAFINFSVHTDNPNANIADVNFFKLPEMSDFDGVILLANSYNCDEEFEYLTSEIQKANIPAISVEYDIEGMPCVVTDNYSGMYELSEHLLREHKVSNFIFIGGPENHPESQARLQALMDACSAYGIQVPSENITHGDWSKALVPEIIENWIKKHNDMAPDAVICANDIMAITACDILHNMGFDIPQDVIVTGYDCISQAQMYTPPITSVNHEWNSMAKMAIDKLLQLIAGESVEHKSTTSTRLVVSGTCGCTSSLAHGSNKVSLSRALIDNVMDPILIDSHFRHFYSAVKKADNKSNLFHALSYMFAHEHTIEGDGFCLFIDPEFFNIIDDNSNLHLSGHSDVYDCIVKLSNGESTELTQYSLKDALYKAANDTAEPGYYLFTPLHGDIHTYGFAMLNGALNAANENQYYIWSRHMMQALEQVRTNITVASLYERMRILSVTDPLTGVYNRAGCESISYPRMIDWHNAGVQSVIMLVDVDRMKIINDKFGHSNGDQALKIVTTVLRQVLPEDYIIARFGGDEFFVSGKLSNPDEDIDLMIANIEASLSQYLEDNSIDFPLTVSIGYAIISPKDVTDIEKGIVQSDSNMYIRKELHHNTAK